MCAFLEKNKNLTVLFENPSPSNSDKEKYLSVISLISEQKFLFEIFNIPYENKKERKSLLSDKTVKLCREEPAISLKNVPIQIFKYEHLIYNYKSIFSSTVFIFLIIQSYFTGTPTNMANSERKNFSKTVLEEKKLSNLSLLKKWIKKRPKDFYEEMINYKVTLIFLKFLKKKENDDKVLKLVSRIFKTLDDRKINELNNSILQIKYVGQKIIPAERALDHLKFRFNHIGFKELARILIFIDTKLFLKLSFFQLDNNEFFRVCDERILTLSRFFELNFRSQKKVENKIVVLTNYFELARFLYQEKNYFSLYILIITLLSKNLESFLKENLKSIEKYYINAAKDLTFYQKLYSDSYRVLRDKLNHHQNEKCSCVPLFKVYQRELFLIEKKFHMFEKTGFLILEKIYKKEKIFQQISSFKKLLVRQASVCYQGFTKNEDYYFLKAQYKEAVNVLL